MIRRVIKACITCQHFEPYHCTLNYDYIGYLYCDKPTKCRAYRLSDDYKKGGKFYERRMIGQEVKSDAD